MKNVMMFGPRSFERAFEYANYPRSWQMGYGGSRQSYNTVPQAPDRRFGVTTPGMARKLRKQGWSLIG